MVTRDSKATRTASWTVKINDEIHRLKRDSDQAEEDAGVIRLQLFLFFRTAVARGILSGLNPTQRDFDPMLDDLVSLVQDQMGNDRFTKQRFKEFAQTEYQNVQIAKAFCDPIYQSIRLTKKYKKSRRLRALYFEVFGAEKHFQSHLLRRMKRPGRNLPTKETAKILGDYILLRRDSLDVVRPAFFRFYEHETMFIRSMGLRLDEDHGRISSKGWVIVQQNGYLVSGYIINRSDPGGKIEVNGGYSNLWINDEADSPLYQETGGLISMTTVFHFQAPYGQFPTAANGLLVRVKGLDKQGGQYSQAQKKRNRATYALQTRLIGRFQQDLTVDECSEFLATRSHIEPDLFEEVLNAEPFIPLAVRNPQSLDPYEDIHIDGRKPLVE